MEKQRIRDSLIEDIELELQKEPDDIDGELIDRGIDRLYALDGLSPPALDDEALRAAARTVRARAAWRRRNALAEQERKRRFTRRAVRGFCAACCAFLFLFSANYVTALLTGSCLPSKAGIKICCGTAYCLCDIAKADGENPGNHP
jgi:hypothetical protein